MSIVSHSLRTQGADLSLPHNATLPSTTSPEGDPLKQTSVDPRFFWEPQDTTDLHVKFSLETGGGWMSYLRWEHLHFLKPWFRRWTRSAFCARKQAFSAGKPQRHGKEGRFYCRRIPGAAKPPFLRGALPWLRFQPGHRHLAGPFPQLQRPLPC